MGLAHGARLDISGFLQHSYHTAHVAPSHVRLLLDAAPEAVETSPAVDPVAYDIPI